MIELADFLQAQRRIRQYTRYTRLIHSDYLSEMTGGDVWLKLENQQPTGSFKVRGALNKLSQLDDTEQARGIVTASAGNHALGVAHAAASLGLKQVDIFVPETAPEAKLNKLRRFPSICTWRAKLTRPHTRQRLSLPPGPERWRFRRMMIWM